MIAALRELPPVCFVIALARILTGSLKLSRRYKGKTIQMEDGSIFRIFRNITRTRGHWDRKLHKVQGPCVLVVSFKFSKLSHRANKIASVIPMLIITGIPGFEQKIYAVNPENGCWQGMYQWKSMEDLEEYKKTFIYRMMNKRAVPESIQSIKWKDQTLDNFLLQHHIDKQSKTIKN